MASRIARRRPSNLSLRSGALGSGTVAIRHLSSYVSEVSVGDHGGLLADQGLTCGIWRGSASRNLLTRSNEEYSGKTSVQWDFKATVKLRVTVVRIEAS